MRRDEQALKPSVPLVALGVVAALAAVYGWQKFYFLTDDSYIDFRYVANSLAGRGLVFNAQPFRPVEGYTSLLWVLVLRTVWELLGAEPPDAAGVLALLCGFGTLWLVFLLFWRIRLPAKLERWRIVFLALILAGTLTNRTFLAWLSSGLETALFNLLFTWWLFECTRPEGIDNDRVVFRISLSAMLCALCRPDGLLIVAGTVALLALIGRLRRTSLRFTWPLLIVPAHILWRWKTYGDWLPNTYRAKFVHMWPESGIRYLASFVLENGVWWWLVLLIIWVRRPARTDEPTRGGVLLTAVPLAVVIGHFAYYTFIIGGDHFEYRIYSHLVPLLFLSAVFFASRLTEEPSQAAALVAGFILVSWPIQWVHWWKTQDLTRREQTYKMVQPIAQEFPRPFRLIVAQWDDWQKWLIQHSVGMRHQEHKVYWQFQLRRMPTRDVGMTYGRSERLIFATRHVGVPGWIFPNVNVVDELGLTDAIVAREGVPSEDRQMAHERNPPAGYVECFRTNIYLQNGVHVREGIAPLTDDEVRACESRDWTKAGGATVSEEQ
jgi:arabinofuranosyltransferase